MSAIDDCQNTPATEHETDLRLDLIARIASGEVGLEDLEMVLETCERTLLLDGGRLVADGPTRDLLADAALMEKHGLEVPYSLRG